MISWYPPVTIGHETIMAKTTFFGSDVVPPADGAGFDFSREFPYQETLMETGKITKVQQIYSVG